MITTSPRNWLRPALVCLLLGAVALPVLLGLRADQPPPRPAAAAPAHPLDPLTADEINRASGILREQKNLPDDVLFPVLTLHEPPKEKVLAHQPVPREAFAVVYNRKTNETSEAVIDLAANRVKDFAPVRGAQPRVLEAEYEAVIPRVREHPEVRAALEKRGITDPNKVFVELWAGGPAEPGRPGARLGRVLFYDWRDGGTAYLRPIAGLMAVVDLKTYEVLRVFDRGVVRVADNRDNFFDPDQVGPLRKAPRPLDVVQPQGRTFTVDGHQVSWQNWSFRFAVTPREGLVLYQVGYEDRGKLRPVLYRASLAELVVPYGDADEAWSWRMPFDEGEYGLGTLSIPLEPGKQVPENAQLFDTLLADDHGKGAKVLRQSVALYERDGGVLWGHTELDPYQAEWRRARELVVTFMMAAGNYDYGFNWVFGQDGSLRVEAELGGIPLAKGVKTRVCERCARLAGGNGRAGDEDRHGTVVAPHIVAPNHQHWFCFRLDLDVDGTANSVSELSARPAGGETGGAWVLDEKVLGTEQDAQRDLDAATQRHWKVFNPGARTELGHFPGYVLEPGGNSAPLAGRDSELLRRAGLLRHHLWVTRYQERERYAAGNYPNQAAGGDGLPRFAEDNENLEGQDVVVWYTCGVTHAPRPEDWPVMPTARTGFRLVPHGFFTRNPALDVPGR
jgi:primary-amine oxidase